MNNIRNVVIRKQIPEDENTNGVPVFNKQQKSKGLKILTPKQMNVCSYHVTYAF